MGADLEAEDGAHVLAQKVRAAVGGKLAVLVANAGVSKSAPIEDLTVADFDRLFAVKCTRSYFLVQQLLPVLGEGSNVIFVPSAAARFAVGSIAAYAATKGAIDTLVKHFAAAVGPRGIRVNAVAPGVVDTNGLQPAGVRVIVGGNHERADCDVYDLDRAGERVDRAGRAELHQHATTPERDMR